MNLDDMVALPNDDKLRVCARAISAINGSKVFDVPSSGTLFVTWRVALNLGASHVYKQSSINTAIFPENSGWFREDLKYSEDGELKDGAHS